MKKLILGSTAILLIIVTVAGIYWLQSPVKTNMNTAGAPASSVLGSETAVSDWQQSLFSTKYPASFRVRTISEKNSGGQYMLSGNSSSVADQVGVTIAPLNLSTLAEVSGVRVRESDKTYVHQTRAYAPSGAIVFHNDTNYETTIFWQHNDMYAAVSATGVGSRSAELEAALSVIVSNWQWK